MVLRNRLKITIQHLIDFLQNMFCKKKASSVRGLSTKENPVLT